MQYQGQGVQYQYNGQYNVPGGHPAGGDDDDDDNDDDARGESQGWARLWAAAHLQSRPKLQPTDGEDDYDDQDDCDRHDGLHQQGSQLVTPQSLASDQISKNLTFLWASFASRPTDRFFIIIFYFIINTAIIFFIKIMLICWSGLQASSLLTDWIFSQTWLEQPPNKSGARYFTNINLIKILII